MNLDVTKYTKSKWMKAGDLPFGRPTAVTIKTAYEHTFEEQNETKAVVEFHELDQHLVLNKTQIITLVNLFGPQTGVWAGQRVNLTPVPSNYQGKPTIQITLAAAPIPTFGGQQLQPEVKFQ